MVTLYATQHSPFEENVVYQNNDGSPKDITGYTSYIRVAKYYGATSPVATIQGTILDATAGLVKYEDDGTAFDVLNEGANIYTRYLINGASIVSVDSGTLILIPAVLPE